MQHSMCLIKGKFPGANFLIKKIKFMYLSEGLFLHVVEWQYLLLQGHRFVTELLGQKPRAEGQHLLGCSTAQVAVLRGCLSGGFAVPWSLL